MSYDADVNRLIQAALFWGREYQVEYDTQQNTPLMPKACEEVMNALEPFRPPRPRVGMVYAASASTSEIKYQAIELTEAVRKALKDAGVEVSDE